MNPMKKQWQQWIRMRSKIHGGQAKPVLPTIEDNSSILHNKTILPKSVETQERGSGPQGGLNTESQTYYESLVRSHASQLIHLKKQYVESPNVIITGAAEKLIERLAHMLPDRLRRSVISCPQAYHIIVCLEFLGVKGYPVKLIEDVLEVITMKSYSIPGNKIYPLLRAVSGLGPPKLKSILHDLGPRLIQVMNELTPNEISCIVGLLGENRVPEEILVSKLLAVFMSSSEMPDFRDLKCLFIGLYQMEYPGDAQTVALLAERIGKTLHHLLHESVEVPSQDIISILRAASFYRIAFMPLFITSCRFIEKSLSSMSISQAADAVCEMHDASFEVTKILNCIKNAIVVNKVVLLPMQVVKLWITLLRFHGSICDSYFPVAALAHKNINLLSHAELSYCFMLLAKVIAEREREQSLDFFRLHSTIPNILSIFLTRLQNIHKESISLNAGLNILVALSMLNYLRGDFTSRNEIDFSEESWENKISYIASIFSAIYRTTIRSYLKSIEKNSNEQAHFIAMNAVCRHGDREKCKLVIDYYFSQDGTFAHYDKKESLASISADIYNALKIVSPK